MQSHTQKLDEERRQAAAKASLAVRTLLERSQLSDIEVVPLHNYTHGILRRLVDSKRQKAQVADTSVYRAKYRLAEVGIMV
jgi:hypothetical protein